MTPNRSGSTCTEAGRSLRYRVDNAIASILSRLGGHQRGVFCSGLNCLRIVGGRPCLDFL